MNKIFLIAISTISVLLVTIVLTTVLVLGGEDIEKNKDIARQAAGGGTLEITLDSDAYAYTGSEVIPRLTVTEGGNPVDSSEYTVEISDNINVGVALLTVTDKNSCEYDMTFRIVPPAAEFEDSFDTTSSQLKISWKECPQAAYYRLYKHDGSDWQELARLDNGQLNYTDTELESGTVYHYAVKGCAMVGEEEFKGFSSNELEAVTLPERPQNIALDEDTLTWEASKGASGYEVYAFQPGEEMQLISDGSVLSCLISEDYSYGYDFMVRAFCELGGAKYYSEFSDSAKSEPEETESDDSSQAEPDEDENKEDNEDKTSDDSSQSSEEKEKTEEDTDTDENSDSSSSKQIAVTNIMQRPELPTGCEITSLTILLDHLGFGADKLTMARNYLPKLDFYTEDGVNYGADFRTTFAGNPETEYSYGCYAPCIVTAANSYLADNGSSMTAHNVTGASFDSLLTDYIDKDIPVLIWITSNELHETALTSIWTTPAGEQVQWVAYEHCVVLTGYDLDSGLIYVSDPLVGNTSYNLQLIRQRYIDLGQQCVWIG